MTCNHEGYADEAIDNRGFCLEHLTFAYKMDVKRTTGASTTGTVVGEQRKRWAVAGGSASTLTCVQGLTRACARGGCAEPAIGDRGLCPEHLMSAYENDVRREEAARMRQAAVLSLILGARAERAAAGPSQGGESYRWRQDGHPDRSQEGLICGMAECKRAAHGGGAFCSMHTVGQDAAIIAKPTNCALTCPDDRDHCQGGRPREQGKVPQREEASHALRVRVW
mmetsp:Transcript_34998/g.74652  ORF Transcript_34998/g.74652 Transcript_34998/m.74652 type:complete len:224 (-) Transcript_34998:1713-2384(-)